MAEYNKVNRVKVASSQLIIMLYVNVLSEIHRSIEKLEKDYSLTVIIDK